MRRIFTLTFFLAAHSSISSEQDYRQQFSDLCSRRDTVAEEKLLAKWNASAPSVIAMDIPRALEVRRKLKQNGS